MLCASLGPRRAAPRAARAVRRQAARLTGAAWHRGQRGEQEPPATR